jgi:hypothetical protein
LFSLPPVFFYFLTSSVHLYFLLYFFLLPSFTLPPLSISVLVSLFLCLISPFYPLLPLLLFSSSIPVPLFSPLSISYSFLFLFFIFSSTHFLYSFAYSQLFTPYLSSPLPCSRYLSFSSLPSPGQPAPRPDPVIYTTPLPYFLGEKPPKDALPDASNAVVNSAPRTAFKNTACMPPD